MHLPPSSYSKRRGPHTGCRKSNGTSQLSYRGFWRLLRAEYALNECCCTLVAGSCALTSVCCQKKTMAARIGAWGELCELLHHNRGSRRAICELSCPTTPAANSGMFEKVASCFPVQSPHLPVPLRARPFWELLLPPATSGAGSAIPRFHPIFATFTTFSAGRRARMPNLNGPLWSI